MKLLEENIQAGFRILKLETIFLDKTKIAQETKANTDFNASVYKLHIKGNIQQSKVATSSMGENIYKLFICQGVVIWHT
jgi:hypothetical protein